MKDGPNKDMGFSLTEVLLAVGTLAIGMIFVAGIFPAGLLLSTKATERTMASIVADEAFAKVRLRGVDLTRFNLVHDSHVLFETVSPLFDQNDFAYPSANDVLYGDKRYFWSAICRRTGPDPSSPVQVTVFVCRKTGPASSYLVRDPRPLSDMLYPYPWVRPMAVYVRVRQGAPPNVLTIDDLVAADSRDEAAFVGDGSIVVDDTSGRLYRVLRRDHPNIVTLDSDWLGVTPGFVWVVPPPARGGRYPCIAVHQKVIQF